MQKTQQQPIRATLPQKNSTPTQPHLSPPQKNKEHAQKNNHPQRELRNDGFHRKFSKNKDERRTYGIS